MFITAVYFVSAGDRDSLHLASRDFVKQFSPVNYEGTDEINDSECGASLVAYVCKSTILPNYCCCFFCCFFWGEGWGKFL